MIDWQDLHHYDLSVSQLYALLQLRCAVFVVEQNCPYQDIDSDDELQPVVIGRVIVSEALRGEKIGQQLMSKALESCTRRWPEKPIYLGAQAHLQNFYGQFGFIPVTDIYEEDGIPHIGMAREVIQA